MTYYVHLPDGQYAAFEDDVPKEEAQNAIRKQFPPEQKTGVVAAGMKGLEDMWRQAKTGARTLAGNGDEAAQQSLEEAKNSPYADQVSFEKVKKAYEDPQGGLGAAAKEAISQLPAALAQNAPNIGAMAGGARLGAMLGSVFPGPGTAIGAGIGAFAPSLLQHLGSNVEAQKEQGQTVDTGNAVAAALPQSALDVAGMAIPLGKNLVGALLGKDVAAMIGKASEAQVERLAKERLAMVLAKGTAVGAIQAPVGVAQQALQRAQAGQSLTDPEALQSYAEAAYQGTLLSPIGAAGRLSERGAAKNELAVKARDADAEAVAKAKADEEAQKSSPDYIANLVQKQAQTQNEFNALKEQVKQAKPTNELEAQQLAALKEQLKAKGKELYETTKEMRGVAPEEIAKAQFTSGLRNPVDEMLEQNLQGEGLQPSGRGKWGQQEAPPEMRRSEPLSANEAALKPFGEAGERGGEEGVSAWEKQLPDEEFMMRQQGLNVRPSGDEINARINGRIDAAVKTLLQEPETAARFVANKQAQLPGLTASENDAIRRAVAKQLPDVLGAKFGESSAATATPGTAPVKTRDKVFGQTTEQYGDQYTQAKQEQQARERSVERREANQPYRDVFGTEDQLYKQNPLARTAEELQGQRTADPLNDAEIRDAQGNRMPTRFIDGENANTVRQTSEGIEEEIHNLRNKLDALRETGVVQKNTLQNTGTNAFGDIAEVQALREQLRDAKNRLRQANENGGIYLHRPEEQRGDEYGRIISRVAESEQKPQAVRVPGPEHGQFRLIGARNAEEMEVTPQSVGEKLRNVLSRDGLAPETRALLERSEPLLRTDEHMRMLDEQLDRVLNGEGLAGTKAAVEGEKIVARPAGEATTPLTYERQINDALKLNADVAHEGVQKSLFDQRSETGKAAGAVYTEPKQFRERQQKEAYRAFTPEEAKDEIAHARLKFKTETDPKARKELAMYISMLQREAEKPANKQRAMEAQQRKAAEKTAPAEPELKQLQGLPGERVSGLKPEDRALREQMQEGTSVPEVQVQNEQTGHNPERTKGAIVKRINELRQQIEANKAILSPTKKEGLLEKKQAFIGDLEEKYRNAKSSGERAVLADKIDEATKQLRRIEEMPENEKKMYAGQAADEAELGKLADQLELIENEIDAKRQREAEPSPRRTPIKGERELAIEEADKNIEAAREGARQADIADERKISSEEETKSEIDEARAAEKTKYTGKLGPSGEKAIKERNAAKETAEKTQAKNEELQTSAEDKEAVRRVDAEMKKAFPDWETHGKTKVMIYPSVMDAMAAHPEIRGKVKPTDKAFVVGDKAFLIARNMREGEALGVVLHEVGSHIGMRKAFSQSEMKALYNAVNAWGKAKEGSVEKLIHDNVVKQLKEAKTPKEDRMDEVIGHAVEEAVKQGIMPSAGKSGGVQSWINKVWSAFSNALEKFGLTPKRLNSKDLVDLAYGFAHKELRTGGNAPVHEGAVGLSKNILFSRGAPKDALSDFAEAVVAPHDPFTSKLKRSLLGFRTNYIDSLAGFDNLKGKMADKNWFQMMHNLRSFQNRMNFVGAAFHHGVAALTTTKEGDKITQVKKGANLMQVADAIRPVAKLAGGEDNNAHRFAAYLVAKKASRIGAAKLDFSYKVTDKMVKDALSAVNSNPEIKKAYEHAANIYADYNTDLMNFLAQSGAITKALAHELTKHRDYVPFYRLTKEGSAVMVLDNEHTIRMGNIKDSPHLEELVGGDQKVLDFTTSAIQNTSMVYDMALRNLGAKSAAYELRDIGAATIVPDEKGKISGNNVIQFKQDGKQYAAKVNDMAFDDGSGIDAQMLVKGLSGMPTAIPNLMRALGFPARVLRRAVTLNPAYSLVRQTFRDSLANTMYAGSDQIPLLSNIKHWKSDTANLLSERGVVGGQVFTGTNEDFTNILRAAANDKKVNWRAIVSKLETTATQADASSRAALYENLIKKGASELEATYLTQDSMNSNKRGLSPSVHWANQLIPFFNAQIQGLDVLYRAASGKMPLNEKMKIQQKLVTRGAMLAAMSMAYAHAMQDDEAYKNADADAKYANWFMRIPGVDQPIKIPIPFELGYIFKSLPEMAVNTMMAKQDKGQEAKKALKYIMGNVVPGGAFPIPTAFKVPVETVMGKEFGQSYDIRDTESAHEKSLDPAHRYRMNTSEMAKMLGNYGNISPLAIEHLVRGFTGSIGMAALQSLDLGFPKSGDPEKAARRLSDMPIAGPFFQPNDSMGLADAVYEKVKNIDEIKHTFEDLKARGRGAEAQAYAQEHINELSRAAVAGNFTKQMGELTKYERAIQAANIPADQKRKALDSIRQTKIRYAEGVRGAFATP